MRGKKNTTHFQDYIRNYPPLQHSGMQPSPWLFLFFFLICTSFCYLWLLLGRSTTHFPVFLLQLFFLAVGNSGSFPWKEMSFKISVLAAGRAHPIPGFAGCSEVEIFRLFWKLCFFFCFWFGLFVVWMVSVPLGAPGHHLHLQNSF